MIDNKELPEQGLKNELKYFSPKQARPESFPAFSGELGSVFRAVVVRVNIFIKVSFGLHFCKHDVRTPYRYAGYSKTVAGGLQRG